MEESAENVPNVKENHEFLGKYQCGKTHITDSELGTQKILFLSENR